MVSRSLISHYVPQAGTLALLGLLAWSGVASAQQKAAVPGQDDITGGDEYLRSCAACHGVDGRGNGPVATVIETEIPDLTTLRERNEGTFPFERVFQIIDGRADVRGHGESNMPVWGGRYSVDVGPDYQPANPEMAEQIVRGRILELVNYLWSIQQPAPEASLIP